MVAITDQEISTRIKNQLYWDGRVQASDVGVTVDNGKATLSGTVPSYRAKTAAVEDARMVLGVKAVDNQLRVQHPPERTVPRDSEILEQVISALAWDADVDSTKIDVDVAGGMVTLKGTVNAYWKKYQAEDDAYSVDGVLNVINELGVVPNEDLADEAIATDIEGALERNAYVDPNQVTVEVNNGTVTLSGVVPDWSAWRAAYNAAAYTTGVVDVIDRLAIRS